MTPGQKEEFVTAEDVFETSPRELLPLGPSLEKECAHS
jgi:hypothetical protein